MRGEHDAIAERDRRHLGSSPHARGAHRPEPHDRQALRLLPACAGSTARVGRRRCERPAHPRMRGEHVPPSLTTDGIHGSSPHARGARPQAQRPFPLRGLIPACAGSTRCRAQARRHVPAHPRMRGEHDRPTDSPTRICGSSPHARGAHLGCPDAAGELRLIPACAGSTRCRGRARGSGWAHPRMRGEHAASSRTAAYQRGSSPHARGAP